jgi:lipopolysaccharide/colanic/teichoic acid biosynthesis glycosyltransferase
MSGPFRAAKRAMDIAGSFVGLVLAAPLMVVLAVIVKLDSPGPAFLFQERAGENGRPFRMMSLRTTEDGAQVVPHDPTVPAQRSWASLQPGGQPRVTRVGHFLRRLRLDELPQLWNVLKGEMSLVGPRAEDLRVVRLYDDWHRSRLAAKPGITGPLRIGGCSDLSLDGRIRLELEYVAGCSVWKDLGILARTIVAIIRAQVA